MVDNGAIKDISLLTITWLNEISEQICPFSLTEEMCFSLRLLIGTCLHIIELSYNMTMPAYPNIYFTMIGLIIPTCFLFLSSLVYFYFAIKNRKTKHFDLICYRLHSSRTSRDICQIGFVLSVALKTINIAVAVAITVNSYYDQANSIFSQLFFGYGIGYVIHNIFFLKIFNF